MEIHGVVSEMIHAVEERERERETFPPHYAFIVCVLCRVRSRPATGPHRACGPHRFRRVTSEKPECSLRIKYLGVSHRKHGFVSSHVTVLRTGTSRRGFPSPIDFWICVYVLRAGGLKEIVWGSAHCQTAGWSQAYVHVFRTDLTCRHV
jgi:hypothetical protein